MKTNESDDFSGELSILSSKCITEFDLRKNDAPESYAVIKGRILVKIYVVYSLDTKCFNLSCIFVDYEKVSITEIVKTLYGNELVDYGDIHNILDFNLAKKFSCKMEAITLLMEVKERETRLQTLYIGVQCVSKLCHNSWGSSKLHMECLSEGEILILWKNKILKQPKPIDDLPTPFEDLFAHSWNGSIDPMSGFKNILQHVQVLAPELHHAHTWGYLSDLFHDECSSVLSIIHCCFVDRAGIKEFNFVSNTNEGSQLSLGTTQLEQLQVSIKVLIGESNFQTKRFSAIQPREIIHCCKSLDVTVKTCFRKGIKATAIFFRIKPSLHFTQWDPGGWSLVHWRSQHA